VRLARDGGLRDVSWPRGVPPPLPTVESAENLAELRLPEPVLGELRMAIDRTLDSGEMQTIEFASAARNRQGDSRRG